MFLARPIAAPGGAVGYVVAGIEARSFASFFERINLDPAGGAISLLRSDGILLARHPHLPSAMGASFAGTPAMQALDGGRSAGSVTSDGPHAAFGGERRLRVISSVRGTRYPVAVSVVVSDDLVLGRWRGTLAWTLGGIALLDTGLVAVVLVVYRAARRRRRLLADLSDARDAAEGASRAKTAFLAHMSHEVRTPMNGVIGVAELLLREPLGDAARRHAETIRRSGRALLGVLDDVLDLSKIEAGRLDLDAARFDLHALVQDLGDLYGEAARAKGIALSVELAGGVPRWVVGDAVRLRQVLLNLVSNALKFTERGAVAVRVAAEAPGEVRFTVQDTGIGIAPEKQAAIFEAFSQGEEGTARRYGGTGLGLSIARQLVRRMGGEIVVESATGAGARFSFRIALATVPAPEAAPTIPAAASYAGRRVLVVEDEAVNAEVTRAMLEHHGIGVEVASDGESALARHAAGGFDLVLMDCEMPGMDGFEATRRIRSREAGGAPGLPIVAVTAHAIGGYRERCLAAGMDDYLAKPFDTGALARILERWLEPAPR